MNFNKKGIIDKVFRTKAPQLKIFVVSLYRFPEYEHL